MQHKRYVSSSEVLFQDTKITGGGRGVMTVEGVGKEGGGGLDDIPITCHGVSVCLCMCRCRCVRVVAVV